MGNYPVSNTENTKAFYKKELVPLGYMFLEEKRNRD